MRAWQSENDILRDVLQDDEDSPMSGTSSSWSVHSENCNKQQHIITDGIDKQLKFIGRKISIRFRADKLCFWSELIPQGSLLF
jgi:hypothetical protein